MSSNPTLAQVHYRVRIDTGTADATPTWAAAEDTNYSITVETTFRVRFLVQNTGSAAGAGPYILRVSKNSGAYTAVTTSTGATLGAQSNDSSTSADEAAIATANFRLTAGAGTVSAGVYDETGSATKSLTNGFYTEFEYGLILKTAGAAVGNTFDFRLYNSTTAFTTYTVTPRITCVSNEKALLANDVSSASSVTNPTVRQLRDDLLANDVASASSTSNNIATLDLDLTDSASASSLTCTRALEGWAQNVDGTWVKFAANVPRITTKGLLIEAAKSNRVLWNRDLTDSGWVKTNVTAAKDQTGLDGVANSASKITATAGNGTCLQTRGISENAVFSVFVKRITGSGVIQLTENNGGTWTAIAVTSSWQRVELPASDGTGAVVGFRIVTSGDAVAIDYVQYETTTYDPDLLPSSPIATTTATVTRPRDDVVATTTIAATGGFSLYGEMVPRGPLPVGEGAIVTLLGNTASTISMYEAGGTGVLVYADIGGDFVDYAEAADVVSYGNKIRAAAAFATNDLAVVVNAGTVVTGSTLTLPTTRTSIVIGRYSATEAHPNNYIQRVRYYNTRLLNAHLQLLTSTPNDACLANDISSATSVTQPAVHQLQAILANDISSATSVSVPTVVHTFPSTACLANDISSATSVTTPAVQQVHGILANDVSSATSVTAPAVQQVHGILANDVSSATSVTQPAAVIGRNLLANDVSSVTSVTAPAVQQVHGILANDVSSATSVTAPAVHQTHVILANDVSSVTSVTQPAAVIDRNLLANDISSATSVTIPAVHQLHGILADDISSATSVTQPALLMPGQIAAEDITSATSVSQPAVHQLHGILANDVSSATSVTQPALYELHGILANDISSATSVTQPTLVAASIVPQIMHQYGMRRAG